MIYVIKQFRNIDGFLTSGSNAGYFLDFKEAEKRVLNNSLDLCENGWYEYTAIMQVNEGLYNTATNEIWYKWNKTQYEVCERPKEFDGLAFTI